MEWVALVEDQIPALLARCRVISESRQEMRRHKLEEGLTPDEVKEEIDLKLSEKANRRKR